MSLTAARYWRADPRGVVRLLNQVFISGAVRSFKRKPQLMKWTGTRQHLKQKLCSCCRCLQNLPQSN